MRPVRTLASLAALLLASGGAWAAPRSRPPPQIRAALRTVSVSTTSAAHVLRELPAVAEVPGAYAQVTRWVEEVAVPRRDGTPRLVVMTVPGGLGLAWARRW